jgi:hypothetical protein
MPGHRFAGVRLPARTSPQKASPDSQHTDSENEDNRIRRSTLLTYYISPLSVYSYSARITISLLSFVIHLGFTINKLWASPPPSLQRVSEIPLHANVAASERSLSISRATPTEPYDGCASFSRIAANLQVPGRFECCNNFTCARGIHEILQTRRCFRKRKKGNSHDRLKYAGRHFVRFDSQVFRRSPANGSTNSENLF